MMRTMMLRQVCASTRGLLVLLVTIAATACSSSSSPDMPPVQPDGDAAAGEEGGAGGGKPSTTGDPCSAAGAPTAVVSGISVSALRLSGSDLIFIDDNGGTGGVLNSRAIRRVATDGSGAALVFAGPAEKQIVSLIATADTVYFLQNESTRVTAKANLYRVAKAGGAAEPVSPNGKGFQADAVIFAVDETQVYLNDAHDFVRVTLATGEQTIVASVDGKPSDPQLLGDKIWFAALRGLDGVFSVPANANAATPTRAGSLTCGPLTVSVTNNGIFCGVPGGVIRAGLDGTGKMTVADAVTLADGSLRPSPPDGEVLYVYGGSNAAPIYRVPTAGGPLQAMACGRGLIGQFAYGPDAIYWSEGAGTGSATSGLYRLARP
jgi:hypothetical protein